MPQQKQENGKNRPVGYCSGRLNNAEKNYDATRKESLVVCLDDVGATPIGGEFGSSSGKVIYH